jgi:hypothetical protein
VKTTIDKKEQNKQRKQQNSGAVFLILSPLPSRMTTLLATVGQLQNHLGTVHQVRSY